MHLPDMNGLGQSQNRVCLLLKSNAVSCSWILLIKADTEGIGEKL